MELTSLPWSKVREVTLSMGSEPLRRDSRGSKPAHMILPTGLEPLPEPHRRYLVKRKFDPDQVAKTWDVQGIKIHHRLSWRLFIPITVRGLAVSWTTRTIGSHPSKYISAGPDEESLPHKDLLYGSDLTKHSIIVVEGPTDVWRIGPGAVATFGLVVSTAQIAEIGAYPVRVVCFDNSDEAQRRADWLANKLAVLPGDTMVVRLESGDDPDSSDEEELQELRDLVRIGGV